VTSAARCVCAPTHAATPSSARRAYPTRLGAKRSTCAAAYLKNPGRFWARSPHSLQHGWPGADLAPGGRAHGCAQRHAPPRHDPRSPLSHLQALRGRGVCPSAAMHDRGAHRATQRVALCFFAA